MQSLLQSVLATYGEMAAFPYSLEMLPVTGMGLAAQSVYDAQGRLKLTLTVLDGIRHLPIGVPASIMQGVEDVRFHTVNGLMLIDGALRIGRVKASSPHVDIPGLLEAIDNQIDTVNRTLPSWKSWVAELEAGQKPSTGDGMPKGKPERIKVQGSQPSLEIKFAGFGDSGLAEKITRQPTTSDWLVYAGIAGAYILLSKMWSK